MRRMNSTLRAFGQRSACADRKGIPCVGEGRRLARKRSRRPISIGAKPPANGRPAPTEKILSASAKADARRVAPEKADFHRRKASGQRSACADRQILFASAKADARRASASEGRFQSAQRPSANGRPAPTEKYSPRRRRPTPGAQAPQKADFNRRKAFGQRSACAPNEFDLEGLRPTVGLRRPKNTLRVGEGRRPARSASEGRFQSAQSLRPAVGLCAE